MESEPVAPEVTGDNATDTDNVSRDVAQHEATHVDAQAPQTDIDLASLHDDDMVSISSSTGDRAVVPMGAVRAGFTWPMPWEPIPTEDDRLVWIPGSVGFPPNVPVTFDNLYCVLHRFHDGTVVIHRLWGVNRLVTENGQPYLPNMPLNVAFMPVVENQDMLRLHESEMVAPSVCGVYLDTIEGVAERARRYYAKSKQPSIAVAGAQR